MYAHTGKVTRSQNKTRRVSLVYFTSKN